MMQRISISTFVFLFAVIFYGLASAAETLPKIAIVPGGDPKSDALLALSEAKLFELKGIELLERSEIDKVLAEQKLSGLFDATNAIELGRILKADLFAVLETTSIVIFDAQTGLRFVDEVLPDKAEDAAKFVVAAVKNAVGKRQKLKQGNLVTFSILEVRNADFPVERDAWFRALAGRLERELLRRGGAVLERSRLHHVNRERQLTGDTTNDLLSSMKLIDLEFTRGEAAQSFKLTARIGDETYRMESSLGQPLDAVRDIAPQLLQSNAATNIEDEARRFLQEADFLYGQGRYDDALDRAEAAFALDPDSAEIKRSLCLALAAVAEQMTNSGKKDMKRVQEILRLVSRAMDIIETNFPGSEFMGYFIPPGNLVVLDNLPECRHEVRALYRRAIVHWSQLVFLNAKNQTDDPVAQFAEAVRKATGNTSFYFSGAGTSFFSIIAAEVSEQGFVKLIGLFHEIPEEAINQIPYDILQKFRELLLKAAHSTAVLSEAESEYPYQSDLNIVLNRIVSFLENDPNAMIRNYGWLARNAPWYYWKDVEQANEYYEKLKQKIEDGPPVHWPYENSMFYEEMRRVAPYRFPRPHSITHEERFLIASCYAEIVEIACQKNESIAASFLPFMNYVKQNLEMLANDATSSRDLWERNENLLFQFLARLETASPENYKGFKEKVDKELEKLQTTVTRPRWDIMDATDNMGRTVISNPFIRDNRLYYFFRPLDSKTTHGNNVRLDSVDLETFQVIEGTFQSIRRLGSKYSFDDQNAYLNVSLEGQGPPGTHNEIYVFPLNGDDPWTWDLRNDVPGDWIEKICAFNGKLYVVASSESGKVVWFVELDVKTKAAEILSSTSAREGKTPFVNLSPAPRFLCFLADELRNRLLFYLADSRPEWRGLWSMDGTTGTFTQHLSQVQTPFRELYLQIYDESGRLFIQSSQYSDVVDLSNGDKAKLYEPIYGRDNTLSGASLWQNSAVLGTIRGDGITWERITLDEQLKQERMTLFDLLELKIPVTFKNRSYIIPTSNFQEFFFTDNHSVILLHRE